MCFPPVIFNPHSATLQPTCKMAEILDNLDKIKKDIDVVIHCRSGARSGAVVLELDRLGYTKVHNLTGGILAWANEIDLSLQSY